MTTTYACAECGTDTARTYVVTTTNDWQSPAGQTEVCRECDDIIRGVPPIGQLDAIRFAASIVLAEPGTVSDTDRARFAKRLAQRVLGIEEED